MACVCVRMCFASGREYLKHGGGKPHLAESSLTRARFLPLPAVCCVTLPFGNRMMLAVAQQLRCHVATHGGIEQNDGAWDHNQARGNVWSEHIGDRGCFDTGALDDGQPVDDGTD